MVRPQWLVARVATALAPLFALPSALPFALPFAVPLHAAPAPQQGAKPVPKLAPAKQKELVTEWFAADETRRRAIEQLLAPIDVLTAADVQKWAPTLLELARKGKKLAASGTNYWIDEEEKVGKYIVNGDRKAKQLIVCLHGGGAGSGEAESSFGSFGATLGGLKGTVAIYPEVLRKTEKGWTETDTEAFVLDLIAAAKRTHPIDPNRVYLTGHSMGGFGTWTLGSRHADLFGGLAAFAGAPTPYFSKVDRTTVVGIEEGVLPCLFNLPISIYQSGDDRQVPAPPNDWAAKELDRLFESVGGAGWKHRYERVEGRGHDFPAAGPGPAIDWAMSHVREPCPKKVIWQPSRPAKRDFYWLHCDELPFGATLTAEVKARDRIEISGAHGAKGLSVHLDARLVDLDALVVVTVDGDAKFAAVPERRLTTLLQSALRLDAEHLFAVRAELQ